MSVPTPPTAQDHLKLLDLEVPDPFDARHVEGIPGQIVNFAGLGVDEVMVAVQVRIEDQPPLFERMLSKQALLDEEVERVVHGRARQRRKAAPDM